MSDVPKKADLIKLDQVRIDRQAGKVCECREPKVVLNNKSRQCYCQHCGARLDAFDVLMDIAHNLNRRNSYMEKWQEQAEYLKNYKPWLKVIRKLEKEYRGKKMLPNCPRCELPFFLEEIDSWTGRQYAEKRIKVFEKTKQGK